MERFAHLCSFLSKLGCVCQKRLLRATSVSDSLPFPWDWVRCLENGCFLLSLRTFQARLLGQTVTGRAALCSG